MSKTAKSKASVLICTPCYGGLVTNQYLTSILDTVTQFHAQQVPHGVFTLANESLISRGRNRCAQAALAGGFDKLLFIDADIGWKWSDVARLLKSYKKVIGGTYPIKQLSPVLALNALPEHHEIFGRERNPEALRNLGEQQGNQTGEVEVRHIPTGFMLIDCSVLRALQPHVPSFKLSSTTSDEKATQYFDYFPVRVVDEVYESEDWAFCSLVREHLDCGVWVNTNIITTHTGTHIFTGEQQ